jgi:hypothetical protein
MIHATPANSGGLVYIASYPKSGNTWIRAFLYNVTRISLRLPPDKDILQNLAFSSAYEVNLVDMFEQVIGKPADQLTIEDVTKARPAVHDAIASKFKGISFLKTHDTSKVLLKMIAARRPALGAIYVVRNPLDIAHSLKDFFRCTQDEAVQILNKEDFFYRPTPVFEVWGSWSQHVERWTQPERDEVLVLRYEDMLEKPVVALARVLHHLQIRLAPPQIVEAVEYSSFSHLQERESATGFRENSNVAERFFREGRAGRWRGELTDQQVKKLVNAHGEMMARFGYLPQ